MRTALTIAGFDPSSGAGVTADLAVFAAHGLFGTSAVTALTVQSTVGVRAVHGVDAGLLLETLEVLEDDLPADGIKIGMLGTAACVAAVAEFLEGLHSAGRRPVIVLDPVIRSSSGRSLLDEAGVALLRERLLPLVDWVTPNLDELVLMSELRDPAGEWSRDRVVKLGQEVQRTYTGLGLVATGGHMEPPDDMVLMRDGAGEFWLEGARIKTLATHGTGCAFSSALLSHLVLGDEPLVAATAAKQYVAEAMKRAVHRGRGRGPMNLQWPLEAV